MRKRDSMRAKHLGAVLRSFRLARKMTQADVAQKSGLDPAYISQVESGTRANPRWETVVRIAAALEAPLDAIARETGMPAFRGEQPDRKIAVGIESDLFVARRILERADRVIESLEKRLKKK